MLIVEITFDKDCIEIKDVQRQIIRENTIIFIVTGMQNYLIQYTNICKNIRQ